MCVGPLDGRNDTLEDAEGSEKFKKWVEDNGGMEKFGSIKAAREAYAKAVGGSGEDIGTDQAETPGPPAPSPTFLGPRIEMDRTGTEDLKTDPSSASSLPLI